MLAVSKGTNCIFYRKCGDFSPIVRWIYQNMSVLLSTIDFFTQRSLAGGTPDCRRVVIIGTVDIDLGGCHHFPGSTNRFSLRRSTTVASCLFNLNHKSMDGWIFLAGMLWLIPEFILKGVSVNCSQRLFDRLEDSDWCFCLLPFFGRSLLYTWLP